MIAMIALTAVIIMATPYAWAHSNTPPLGQPQQVQQHHQGNVQQQQQPPPPQGGQATQAQQQQAGAAANGHHNFGTQAEVHDAEHIKSHLENKIEVDTKTMTPEQLQFHYFKMHDSNNDNKLDGIELVKAITHIHDDDPNAHTAGAEARPPAMSEQQMEEMIDNILKDDDFNNDGLIDYSEFIRAQQGRGPAR